MDDVTLFNPVAGVQEYVFAPLTVSGVFVPLHIAVALDTVKEGAALTDTMLVFADVHPLLAVPVMV